MSMKAHAIGRTARIIRPYAVEQRNGRNGVFESRMVMFSLATDRDYKKAVTNADGSMTQERPTDFFACRATGPIADLFNKYCSAVKKDENGQDKLVSRRIAVEGHFEKYQATRTETVQFVDNGVQKTLQVNLPEERDVLVVESIEFLDGNPVNNQNTQSGTTATVVMTAQPVQNMIAQPVQNMTAQPVQNTPVQTVQSVPVAPVAEAPTAQTISGEVAPF